MWYIKDQMAPAFEAPLLDNQYVAGGIFVVRTNTQRNNIKKVYRLLNGAQTTLVLVSDVNRLYKLINNPATEFTTDSDWETLSLGLEGALIPVGEWDPVTETPDLTDAGALGRNGEFYFVTNAGSGYLFQQPDLFQNQAITLNNGDWIISIGDRWAVVRPNVTWDMLVKPQSIIDYVAGIVIEHTHVVTDVIGLQTALDTKFDQGDTADHTIDFAMVPDQDIVEVEFLKQHYYRKTEVYSKAEVDGVVSNIELDDLLDVVLTGPVPNQVLMYNGIRWVNGNIPTTGFPTLQQVLGAGSDLDVPQDITVIPGGSLTFVDGRSTEKKGIEYSGVVIADFTSNSLVHKAYADSRIGGKTVDSLVSSPTIAQDGYVIAWNYANQEYELVPDSGGGGGGGYDTILANSVPLAQRTTLNVLNGLTVADDAIDSETELSWGGSINLNTTIDGGGLYSVTFDNTSAFIISQESAARRFEMSTGGLLPGAVFSLLSTDYFYVAINGNDALTISQSNVQLKAGTSPYSYINLLQDQGDWNIASGGNGWEFRIDEEIHFRFSATSAALGDSFNLDYTAFDIYSPVNIYIPVAHTADGTALTLTSLVPATGITVSGVTILFQQTDEDVLNPTEQLIKMTARKWGSGSTDRELELKLGWGLGEHTMKFRQTAFGHHWMSDQPIYFNPSNLPNPIAIVSNSGIGIGDSTDAPSAALDIRALGTNTLGLLIRTEAEVNILQVGESGGNRIVRIDIGSDATGDMWYRNASGNFTRIPAGAQDTALVMGASSIPAWTTIYTVSDVAYGVGWNGDLNAPSKNAVYDKIESILVGGLGYTTITEEGGGALTARNTLNFVGSAMTAVDDTGNSRTNVTITDASGTVGGFITASTQTINGLKTWQLNDAATNSVQDVAIFRHITTAVATVGFGARLNVTLENASGNEITAGRMIWSWADATNSSEDSILSFRVVQAGNDFANAFRVDASTDMLFETFGPLKLMSYATGSLPSAASYEGCIVYDSTTQTVKFSNGTTWATI